MKVSTVSWISRDGNEAEVCVTDGVHQILCFAHPFSGQAGDVLYDPLFIVDPNDIVKENPGREEVIQEINVFSCKLFGQLQNKNSGLLRIGNIFFELDENLIPGDIYSGDVISFSCNRVDV